MNRNFLCACIPALALGLTICGCLKKEAARDDDAGDGKKGFFSKNYAPQYAWDGQQSTGNITASIDVTHDRATAVLRALSFSIKQEESGLEATNGRVVGEKEDHTQVAISLHATGPGSTEVKVKVGAVGDRTSSERILDELKKPNRTKKFENVPQSKQ